MRRAQTCHQIARGGEGANENPYRYRERPQQRPLTRRAGAARGGAVAAVARAVCAERPPARQHEPPVQAGLDVKSHKRVHDRVHHKLGADGHRERLCMHTRAHRAHAPRPHPRLRDDCTVHGPTVKTQRNGPRWMTVGAPASRRRFRIHAALTVRINRAYLPGPQWRPLPQRRVVSVRVGPRGGGGGRRPAATVARTWPR